MDILINIIFQFFYKQQNAMSECCGFHVNCSFLSFLEPTRRARSKFEFAMSAPDSFTNFMTFSRTFAMFYLSHVECWLFLGKFCGYIVCYIILNVQGCYIFLLQFPKSHSPDPPYLFVKNQQERITQISSSFIF